MKDILIKLLNYRKELKAIVKELKTLPPGYLTKRGTSYGHSVNGKEVGITKNRELIRKLCRKSYLLARKKLLTKNISIVSKPISKLDITTRKETIRSLSNSYQGLPMSYFLYPSSIEDWLAEPYEKNPFQIKKSAGYTTKRGITFRSKSEYIIATFLDFYNIPYRYEAAISLDRKREYPDFLILNPFTGALIIWEHFGALNQSGYGEKMSSKMNLYMRNGYIPYENLICTFEPDIKDTSRLEVLIENIILKVA